MQDPLFRALWLEAAPRLRPLLLLGAVAAMAMLFVDIAVFVESHAALIAFLLATQAAMFVRYHRRKWTEVYARNWLSTLPLPSKHVTRVIALRTFAWPLLAVLALCLVLRAGSAFLIAEMSTAIFLGSLVGWWIASWRRYERNATRKAAMSLPVSTVEPLQGWVTGQAKTWLRPRTLARSLIPAMLALPMGISGNDAIAILILWALAIYLALLLRALVLVTRESASWLAPTPMPFHRFAWRVAREPLLSQVSWTVAAAILLIALGYSPAFAIRIAEGWLALVSVTSALALAHASRPTAMRFELIGSIFVLALIERFTRHVALPCALLFSAWRLRRASR